MKICELENAQRGLLAANTEKVAKASGKMDLGKTSITQDYDALEKAFGFIIATTILVGTYILCLEILTLILIMIS